MRIGTKEHPAVGRRVQVPAYSDCWMRGARFGTVTRVVEGRGNYLDPKDPRGASVFVVRLDHPRASRQLRFIADDCTYA